METTLSQFVLSERFSYRITRHVVFWLACVLFFGAIYSSLREVNHNKVFNEHALVEAILFLPPHMFLGYSIIYGLFPRFLFKGRYVALVIGIVVLILATSAVSYLTLRFLVNPYRAWQDLPLSYNLWSMGLLAGLRGSNTVAGFMAAIKLAKYWHFKKLENEQLEKASLRSELEMLKGQLHPHFLFNTLNNLYGMVLRKSEESPAVVQKLSWLLHYMLTESRKNRIPIDHEIDFLQNYITLEKIRFGDRIDVQIHVDGNSCDKVIAPLVLLPFVENAFKYGANEMLEQPWINLTVTHRKELFQMKLINGKSRNHNGATRMSTGIGLSNVKRRLELIYPGRHQLRTIDQGESYFVHLDLQLEPS